MTTIKMQCRASKDEGRWWYGDARDRVDGTTTNQSEDSWNLSDTKLLGEISTISRICGKKKGREGETNLSESHIGSDVQSRENQVAVFGQDSLSKNLRVLRNGAIGRRAT